MANLEVNSFEIFKNVDDDLKSIIKLFYVFKTGYDISDSNALFVTINDKVFGMGNNKHGVCGLGHNKPIQKPQLIPELCDKCVKEFFNGVDFVLCLTSDNNLFGWGKNDDGQLGIGCAKKYRHFEPQLIEFFNDKNIVQVCCGTFYTLVLTEEGVVYGWGDNTYGQTGSGQRSDKFIASPKQWIIDRKIIKVHCTPYNSFAITERGRVYCCGFNNHCQLGSKHPKNMKIFRPNLHKELKSIESIITSKTNTYFVTKNGYILICGQYFDREGKLRNVPLYLINENQPIVLSKSFSSSNFIIN